MASIRPKRMVPRPLPPVLTRRSCGMHNRIITLRQNGGFSLSTILMVAEGIYYRTHPDTRGDDTRKLLHSYLSLDVSLPELYTHWSDVDSHFKNTALRFAGVRILRQDPWECLVGFICSSNNNIARITQMVPMRALRALLIVLDGETLYTLWDQVRNDPRRRR
jgi:N-glycosylase/DNA lyase